MSSLSSDQRQITYMDSNLFRKAKDPDIRSFDKHELDKVSRQGNTVLHIRITALTADETQSLEEILKRCPALLLQANERGEIPLHLAARYGFPRIVEILIDRPKPMADRRGEDIEIGENPAAVEMLRMTTKVGNTPLHEAVRFGHYPVAAFIVSKDPSYVFPANAAEESPLYMAAERGNLDLVNLIVDNSLATGPDNQTALHAATIGKHEGVARTILEKRVDLTEQADKKGWVPLHYSADMNQMTFVRILLTANKNALYIQDSEGQTPLHIAASHGHVQIMERMYEECPDCYEFVDKNGRNALHYAVDNNKLKAVKFILKDPLLSYLLNEKDHEDKAPFHLTAESSISKTFLSNSRVDKLVFNKHFEISRSNGKCCPLAELRRRSRRDNKDEDNEDKERAGKKDAVESKIDKAREASLVIAVLIATVSFQAGFTIPGSYVNGKDENAAAIMKKSLLFQIFMVMNGIAFIASSFAVSVHVIMPLWQKRRLLRFLFDNNYIIFGALATMVFAFVIGMYLILETLTAGILTVLSVIFFIPLVLRSFS